MQITIFANPYLIDRIMSLEEEIKQQKQFENEYEKLVVNIIYTNCWLTDQQAKVFKPFDLTGPQFNVLRILRGQYPKPCTVNLIIERMLDRMSNASRIVDRLEKKGLVERTVCPSDKRAKDVLITKKGLDVLKEVSLAFQSWTKKFGSISKERVVLTNELLDDFRID